MRVEAVIHDGSVRFIITYEDGGFVNAEIAFHRSNGSLSRYRMEQDAYTDLAYLLVGNPVAAGVLHKAYQDSLVQEDDHAVE